jgi:hypothetical protein
LGDAGEFVNDATGARFSTVTESVAVVLSPLLSVTFSLTV